MRKGVLIVDDAIGIRTLVRGVLEHAGLQVCGEASNGIEAIEAALRLKPDLIVLDYSMPEMNGVEAASVLKHRMPGVRIIIFTLHADAVGEAVKKSIKVDLVLAKLDGMDNLIVQIKTLLGLPNNSRAPSA